MSTPTPLILANIDFESTGVDPDLDEIWEAAVIVTDGEYNELARMTTLVRPTDAGFKRFYQNPFVVDMHTKSGLLAEMASADRSTLPTVAEVEQLILQLINSVIPAGAKPQIALGGGGVAHYDKPVIDRKMLELTAGLTYWSDDVSSARRSYERANGFDIIGKLKTDKTHRALDDIENDVEAARRFFRLYKQSAQKSASETGLDRALSGLALVDAFNDSKVYAAGDDLIYTKDTTDVIETLLKTTNVNDVILGLMDVASALLTRVAQAEKLSERTVVQGYRDTILGAIASASADEIDTSFSHRA